MIALSADRLGRRLGKAGVALDRLVKVLLGHTHVSTTQVYHEANERDAEKAARHIQIRASSELMRLFWACSSM